MPEDDKSPNLGQRRRFTRDLPIEGVFLHVRAIIEQGRTQEFFKACEEHGFTLLKGQSGIVDFTRRFVEAGEAARSLSESYEPASTNRFVQAIKRKPTIDHC